ncbi:MAG: LysM peptidoglycan-binding domain-containing protein [Bacteroidota bacterium]
MLHKLPSVCIAFVFFILCANLQAQDSFYRGSSYPFIKEEINEIDNNLKGLRQFYRQLDKLETGEKKQLNIVHIGDSHIQADWFSGIVRMELQKRFGSAGRGLIFPYAVAKTNGPKDVSARSNIRWESRRNSRSVPHDLHTGVSGMGIRSQSPNFELRIRLGENPYQLDYSFNQVTLFAEQGPINFDLQISPTSFTGNSPVYVAPPIVTSDVEYHTIESGDNLTRVAKKYGLTIQELKDLNGLESSVIYAGQKLKVSAGGRNIAPPRRSIKSNGSGYLLPISDRSLMNTLHQVNWEDAGQEVYLRGRKSTALQSQSVLYGLVLENTHKKGILYHMIGVNGAEFKHFNRSGNFWRQVRALNPDLIIISLGTNESVNRSFNANRFFEEIDEFISDLEQQIPYTDILFTTPPEALRSGREENPNVRRSKNVLLSYSLANELACWDFFEIMGGSGSIRQWKDAYLAQKDYLHLTKAGYELQGKLLFRALMKGYEDFRLAESR